MRTTAGNSACFSLASVNLNFGTSATLKLSLNEELYETWPWGGDGGLAMTQLNPRGRWAPNMPKKCWNTLIPMQHSLTRLANQ